MSKPTIDADEYVPFRLNGSQLEVLAKALGEVPHKFAAPVMEALNTQLLMYVNKRDAAPPPEATP